MKRLSFVVASASSLLLLLPVSASGQTKASAPPAATPIPPPLIPPATGDAALTPQNVEHVRKLVRDVETNTDNIKSNGSFGAQLWLIEGLQFFQDWVKPATPAIDPVRIAPRGQDIYTAIIFYGIAHDSAGLANVSYDITVHRPDGSIYSHQKDLIGWQGLAPQDARSLELGRARIAINIAAADPAGLYTVDVLLRDNISRQELPLKQTFVVQ